MGVERNGYRTLPSPERCARYRWAAAVTAGGRTLDAACGAGWGTAVLAAQSTRAVGLDLSAAAIADANRDYGGLADFHEADLRELPFADDEFDSVVCFEAIAHVAEPAQVLDELRRVLRPGGPVLVSAPNPAVYPPGNPLHQNELSAADLERLLGARFANVAVHRQQSYFASLLGDAQLLGDADPAGEVTVRVVKLVAGPPGSELHALAAASDGELPPAPAWLALGADVDYEEQRALLEEWQGRALRAEAEALALRGRPAGAQ